MSELEGATSVAPWRSLWLRPGDAIEAIVARNSQFGTLTLAALGAALECLLILGGQIGLFAGGWGETFWSLAFVAALGGALIGVLGLYFNGFLVKALARGLGGQGSASATRAALAWGSAPTLCAAAVMLGISFAYGEKGTALWPPILLALIGLAGGVWSIVLVTAMLARVHRFRAWRAFVSWLVADIGAALVIAAAVRTLLFQPFSMPSSSMAPTLLAGDYFFATKWDYGYSRYSLPYALPLFEGRIFSHEPQRGDVIIFRKPRSDVNYVKRIVGLPGDKIQIAHGRLLINGAIVERREIKPGAMIKSPLGKSSEAPTYDELLPGGATHRIVQVDGDDGVLSNTEVYDTPPGAYFVLGDNRDNSTDSRIPPETDGVGFVPLENIIGRAKLIYFSTDADQTPAPLRPGRIGLGVQ
jgi:signal peptidase I